MRLMLAFSIHPEKGDALIKEGRIGETMESILQELQPEAAYFTDVEGTRGGYLVVNMEDASQIPAVTEPLLLGLGASVHMQPVMTPEDLRGAAGEALQQMGQKYG
jgi:predicted component of type VI protein secretion system